LFLREERDELLFLQLEESRRPARSS